MPEPGDDAGNHFSVPMPADQDMRPGTAIPQRNHELPGVPEGQDDGLPTPMQGVHPFGPFCPDPHGPPQQTDHAGAEEGQCGQEQPVQHIVIRNSLFVKRKSQHPRFSRLTNHVRILELNRVKPLVEPATPQQLLVRSAFDDPAAIEHQDTARILDRGEAVRDDQGRPVLH